MADVTLPMIAEDQGRPEAAKFRIGLAMVATMLAEVAAELPGGAIPAPVLNDFAANIIEGNERGISFVAAHVDRMKHVAIAPPKKEDSDA